MRTETVFMLPTKDAKSIYCVLNQCGSAPAESVVVLSHGLTGGPYEYMHQAARDYFNARGYDVVRFAYYWNLPECRMLEDTTLEIHGRDLNTVIGHVRETYRNIFVCGHSYGGLTLLFANPRVNALSFWDAAYRPGWVVNAATIPSGETCVIFGGKRSLIGTAMAEEAARLVQTPSELAYRAGAILTPSQIVVAGAGDKQATLNDLMQCLTCPKEMHTVPGADHNFYYKDTMQDLLRLTESWFWRHQSQASPLSQAG